MKKLVLFLLFAGNFLESCRDRLTMQSGRLGEPKRQDEATEGEPLPATTKRIQAVEGQNATVRCRFNHPDSFIAKAVEWIYNNSKIVLFSRRVGWIPHEVADAQFKYRTSVNSTDLTRGVLSVTILNVTRSDSGIYTEPKDLQTQGNNSSLSDAAENRNDVWKIVLPCVLILAVIAVAVIVILVKRGVMNRICKKGGEPVENGDELKERRRSGTPEPQWGVKISRVLQKKA
ncbi:uncharacterized protein LOC134864770 isoform X2 [Eleginops maclovinus]|uniref:uncharacterized protein LOC134864770 isoform X2 n=1 Tax=Eleginops maclovinus TaxID=56733 RepID=UPI003080CF9E